MYDGSIKLMESFRDKYLTEMKKATILDVGSRNVHKHYHLTYRDVFKPPFQYVGMDIVGGKNVDIIGWENVNGVYDVVVSGQTIEHVRRPWDWLKSLTPYFRAYICIIAPHTWKEHKHPIDTYRYFPDGMRDLFEYAGIREVEITMDGKETMGIGTK